MEPEVALVKRARGGDRAAFEELVRRTSRLIYSRLYVETGDRHLAEDLAQETYLRAFRSLGRLTDPAEFRSWLMTIAQNAAIDSHRRSARRKRKSPPRVSQEILDNLPAPEIDEEHESETRDKVRAILQSLPEEYRLPLILRYIDGADYEAITLQLGLTEGALRGLLHRGMQKLRRAVKTEVRNESR